MAGGDRDWISPSAILLDAEPKLVAAGFPGEIGQVRGFLFEALGTLVAIQSGSKTDPGGEGAAIAADGKGGIIVIGAGRGQWTRSGNALDIYRAIEFLDEFAVRDFAKREIETALLGLHLHH